MWVLFLAGAITWGSAAIAQDAAATTNTPVATAAAGRSQPIQPAPPGRSDSGLNLSATVDRTDFGVNWNNPLPSGESSLANDVTILADLQFVQAGNGTD